MEYRLSHGNRETLSLDINISQLFSLGYNRSRDHCIYFEHEYNVRDIRALSIASASADPVQLSPDLVSLI